MTATATGPDARLPDGFQAQVDPRCAARGSWTHLVGGSPTRLLRMSRRATDMIDVDGRITVVDEGSRQLARTLIDAGVAHPRPMFGPHDDQVTVIIPVRDNQAGVDRLLATLHGGDVVVVDDGSTVPIVVPGWVHLVRLDTNRGPAAARNHGAAVSSAEFLVFLDSDVVPLADGAAPAGCAGDWLTALLAHFSDPAVGLVAPRIVALPPAGSDRPPGIVERYEARFSALDMGPRESPVVPGGPLPYVPSAAMVVRRSAFLHFDAELRVAEDVDMCWRMAGAGWRMRYDPVVEVAHEHRTSLPDMLARRRFYGTGAAHLARRHGRRAAPMVMGAAVSVAMAALLTRTRLGAVVAVVAVGFAAARIRARIGPMPGRERIVAGLTGRAVGSGLTQVAGAVCRHYWPLALLGALMSRRLRGLFVQVALVDAAVAWIRYRHDGGRGLGPLSFAAMRRLDDLAYGAGLWQGAVAHRDPTALLPVLAR